MIRALSDVLSADRCNPFAPLRLLGKCAEQAEQQPVGKLRLDRRRNLEARPDDVEHRPAPRCDAR